MTVSGWTTLSGRRVGPDSRQNDPQRPVANRQAGPFRIPLQDIELMTEREVLQNQRTVGPQRREQRAEKDEYQAIHDTIISA
jgi:hypothetical protein